jgi:hypothetical protein
MMQRSAVSRYGLSFMASVNQGSYQPSTSPRTVIIKVPVEIDGRVLTEVVARETLQ